MRPALLGWLALAGVLAGCASRPRVDGPEATPPAGLAQRPDAEPRIEPLRVGGPNKPYEVLGQRHVPLAADLPLAESGLASWYGRKFHGLPTASGEPYDMYAMTAAHKTMPIPSYARVRNPANGRAVVVRINDRGPFAPGRVIDLSYTAALKLGVLNGVAPVEVQRLTFDSIRSGSWRGGGVEVAASGAGGSASGVPALPPDDVAPGNAPPAAGVWLQLGAFRNRDAALQLQQRALGDADAGFGVALVEERGLLRVQAGPFASRTDALAAAERLRGSLGISAVVVERR